MKKESRSWFGKGNLHLATRVDTIVQAGDGSETVFDSVKLYQGHVFLGRLLQNLNTLDFAKLLKDFKKHALLTNLSFERRDMESR